MFSRGQGPLRRPPKRLRPPDLVANAKDATVDLTPTGSAAHVRGSWDALLPGGPVPLIAERVIPEEQP